MDEFEPYADALANLLRRCGYDERRERTGESALSTAADFDPDVVFVDLRLPDMDGYRLADQLRQQGSDTRPKIVALTHIPRGEGGGDDAVFDDYLLKRPNVETLRRVVEG